ncbi:hypothetical protein RI367_001280 [Sorochytrium milnesiophthora]
MRFANWVLTPVHLCVDKGHDVNRDVVDLTETDNEDERLARELQRQWREEGDECEASAALAQALYQQELQQREDVPAEKLFDSHEFDLHRLFQYYDVVYFEGKLAACEVRWSKRMTLCAGLCYYQKGGGYCSVRLSEPLLKLRTRQDCVNTLLHEMIHAYLFVTDGNDDHDGHGPAFTRHMERINAKEKSQITVYHSFHNEVKHYRVHVWQCSGPCRSRPPYFGKVSRSMNRPPQPADSWWKQHQQTCGGTYTKVDGPEIRQQQQQQQQQQDGAGSSSSSSSGGDAQQKKDKRRGKRKRSPSPAGSSDIRRWAKDSRT